MMILQGVKPTIQPLGVGYAIRPKKAHNGGGGGYVVFSHICRPVTKQPTQQQFWGFRRAHGTGYIGLAASTWVPMGAQVPILSPNDHPNPSHGQRKGFHEKSNFEKLSRATKQPTKRENSRVLTGKGPYVGGRLGVPRVETRDPRHGLGGPYTRKTFSSSRSKYTHTATIHQYTKKF